MPRLRLPPLPDVAHWRNHFTRSNAKTSSTKVGPAREVAHRTVLASPELNDLFVRKLGIREGEVVIDAYSYCGAMTRALLAGGRDETTSADWKQVLKEQPVVGAVAGEIKRRTSSQFTFPTWDMSEVGKRKPLETEEKVVQPRLVVAAEPHVESLGRGLGFVPDLAGPSRWEVTDAQTPERLEQFKKERTLSPSMLEKNLVFAPLSPYAWSTFPKIMSHPLVMEHLEKYDPSKEGAEATMRPWSAPPPHVTVVVTLPTATNGDQLISQWISSAVGSEEYGRSWLWAWGRVRLAVLAQKSIYDRIMAQPGETIHCKLSVMAQALFNLRPLPPYHHVPDVDKQSTRVETDWDKIVSTKRPGLKPRSPTTPALPPIDEVTTTTNRDFHSWSGIAPSKRATTTLDRPLLLGMELIPRDDSPITPEQRELWEFILRKCFVREAAPISQAVVKLAFGAENLLPKFAAKDSPYAGAPVLPDEVIRDLTVEQWARVVDVFDKWPFKPENMLVDIPIGEDTTSVREIGTT